MLVGMIDESRIKKLLEYKQLQNIFDRLYMVDLVSRCCEEFVIADLTTLNTQSYDSWLISFAKKMYRLDSVEFFAQMELKRICLSLTEQEPRYIVYCRQIENDSLQEFKFNISYADESQTQLIILREELTSNHPRPLETINELAHCNARFQFLVNRLAEDFIEIKVETGVCRMFPAENNMESKSTLKDQIAWWAEHIIAPEERAAFIQEYELENLVQSLRGNNGYHSATYTSSSGNTKNSLLIISTLVKEDYGKCEEYIFAYAQDITPLKVEETRNKQLVNLSQQLLTLSQTEPVTGLFNRASCEKLINEHIAASQNQIPGTMLLIDIDYFKNFNDQHGHSTGDFVLKILGKTMRDIFRSDDIISRWGGDEFVVFMRDIHDKKTIKSRIERLRVRLRQCKKDGVLLPISISVGGKVATPEMSVKVLFDYCDKALYKVKAQGRDNYLIETL